MSSIVIILLSVLGTSYYFFGVEATNLKDLNQASDYAKDSIVNLFDKKIITGDEKGRFNPRQNISRSQMVTMIVKNLKIDTSNIPDKPTFNDVPKNHWAYKYIELAYQKGIISGMGFGRFGPDEECTREQMATILINSIGLSEGEIKQMLPYVSKFEGSYTDKNNISSWAYNKVKFAVQYNLLNGSKHEDFTYTFNPKDNATKEQMAVVMDRFLREQSSIEDSYTMGANIQVSSYGILTFPKAVKWLSVREILDADGNNVTSQKKSSSNPYIDWTEGYKIVNARFMNMERGETYTVKFEFKTRENDKIYFYEKTIEIPTEYRLGVRSIIFQEASRIKIFFDGSVDKESAQDINNYTVKDDQGDAINIENIKAYDSAGEAVITLERPITQNEKVQVIVENIKHLRHYSEGVKMLSYATREIIGDDTNPPRIIEVHTTENNENFTSVTIVFNEPIYSGNIRIDGNIVGKAKGEKVTINGLNLDKKERHSIQINELSDGINVTMGSKGIQPSLNQ
ncbi:S-layer homology domain-containing protein [Tepidibacter aestuarii]|uniref:S-layer homology domain-containing protein n=1 Tax=Tepidibacter aestuarii TaxID=2925782 RepID=UPI0020BFB717|nr:S-layer homology domain-containing protein [Tepidibacter aestuarii]CAH2213576.1 protein of unknown function [Tepidibacter aestuarii]